MCKQIVGGVHIYCILLLVLLCCALGLKILDGEKSAAKIYHGISDDFKADIPKPFEKIGNKYYYIPHNESVNWFGAVEKCRQVNGHLVNLQNELELLSIQKSLNSSINYWTDLNNLVDGKTFYSLTTGTGAKFLNNKSDGKKDDHNMCGILKFNKSAQEFKLEKQKCTLDGGFPICETTHPTTISILVW